MKKLLITAALNAVAIAGAYAQANTSLSNLTATSVNHSLIPITDNSKNLGSKSLSWKNLYQYVIYMNGSEFTYDDGFDELTGIGWDAMLNTNAAASYDVTGIGYHALLNNFGAFEVTAIGSNAAYSFDANSFNNSSLTAVGSFALYFKHDSGPLSVDNCSGIGVSALYSSTAAINCTADGADALYNSTADGNTGCGWSAGYNVQTGDSNTFLGYNTDCGSLGTLHNATAIGANASVISNNTVRVGNSSVTSIGGFVNWSNVSDARVKKNIKENVPGLAFIQLLKPVTFNYDLDAADRIMFPEGKRQDKVPIAASTPEKQTEDQSRIEKEKIVYSGFLAQDVEAAAEKLGYDFSGVEKPANENSLYGLRYDEFVVPLVKAVQELNQQQTAINDSENVLQSQTDDLEKKVSAMEREVSAQEDSKISSSVGDDRGSLSQNIPNPFGNSTLIPFRIPKDCQDAFIMVTNSATSEVISMIPISSNEDHIQIDAGTLSSGTYSYSLFVNGKLVDTKQMVLSK